MYRPLAVIVISLFTSSLRNSAGIPNIDDGHTWFSIIDPTFSQSFLIYISKVILMMLLKKGKKVEKEADTNTAVEVETPPSVSRSGSSDTGFESPPLTASVKKVKEEIVRQE